MVTWTRANGIATYAKWFKLKEFECGCGVCSKQLISLELLKRLDEVREEWGAPLTITSGYRCAKWQHSLASHGLPTAKVSQHCKGNAADVRCKDIKDLPRLLAIAERHFKAIGVADSFLHLDTRDDKVRRWRY